MPILWPMTPVQTPAATKADRRRHPRVTDIFSATLESADSRFKGAVSGVVRDYDQDGACLRAPKSLPVGAAINVKLRLPRSLTEFFRGMKAEFPARVAAVRPAKTDGRAQHDLILRWDKPLPQLLNGVVLSHQRRIGFAVGALFVMILLMKWKTLDYFWYSPATFIYSMALAGFLLSRFIISWYHKTPKMTSYVPSLSVVISVRNEEKAIGKTVETCFAAEYPDELREVIVIDDGSIDGTARVLRELQNRYPALKTHGIPPSGKRFAMAEGIRRAKGEIVVFVDSDTFLTPDALRQIVCGFEDPTLGASAGYTGVENSELNALTGMQEVRYYVSNRLLKSSESIFGCVTCCPGCLSAYRRVYLLEILDEWLNQKFLGLPATFGDDRSLTNYILRKYRVIYNDNAVASTLVPETWGHYMRQQLRWKKSWLRETWIASGFMWRKHPVAVISFYASSFFSLLSPLMLLRVLYLEGKGTDPVLAFYMTGLVLIALLQSLYFLYKRPSSNWSLGMLWCASSLVIMGPQTYYALMTVRRNHWGTR